MAGFDNDVVYGTNVDFTGTSPVSGQINLNGELLVGATSAPFIRAYVPTGSGGVSISTGPGTIDFTLANIPNSALTNSSITINAGTGLTGGGTVSLGAAVGISMSVPVTVPNGGTAAATLTNHGVLLGQGTNAVIATSVGATGTVLIGSTGSDPSFSSTPTVTSITISNAPVSGTDGTNKTYVDTIAAGFEFKSACYAGTTGALTASYNNGVAGVGAFLLNTGALAAFSVDGVSPPITSRILVKDQGSTFQNGIYTLTTVGSGAIAWVLTRATDYDQTTEIQAGDLIPVEFGTVNANTVWLETATVASIGTDPIVFTKFSSGPITTTQYDVLVGGANNSIGSVGPGSTGQVLQSGGNAANPAYSTATFPSTASGTGSFLRANGTNWVASSSTIPDTFAQGDIIYGSASNVLTALAKDTNSTRVLTNTGTTNNPAWAQVTLTSGVTGTLPVANGGTSLATLTIHALYVGNGTTAPTALSVGATGTLLVGASSADPAFATSATGDFTFTSSTAGATRLFTVSNTDNTNAASNATIKASTGGSSAGDARYSASTTTTEWSWGVDNSATTPSADPFVISSGAALGTTNIMAVATTGEINFPLQSAFLALLHTGVSNVTGDGTTYTNIYDTEVFDQNSDFDLTSSVYTAPITGRVQFSYQSNLQGGTTITAGIANIVTSNRTYAEKCYLQIGGTVACCANLTVLADMDAADTASSSVQTTDGGGKIDDTPGDAAGTRNYFSGYIAC